MRYVTIPENAYRACDAMSYTGENIMFRLIAHAFDGDSACDPEDIASTDRPVFIALHDEIDDSLFDDEERPEPFECECIGHVMGEVVPLVAEVSIGRREDPEPDEAKQTED